MPGRASSSRALEYMGGIAAVIGVLGYVVFDWRFGDTDAKIPFLLGVLCVGIAVGWELYRRS